MNEQAAYFDNPTHRYQYALNPPFAQRLEMEHLERKLGRIPGNTIVDFGAGSGRATFHFLKKGYTVTAVDVSKQSLSTLQTLYNSHKTSSWGKLRIATTLPKTNVSAVIGADILHHVDMKTYLPILYRILTPGGRIAFSEPNAWHIPWYIHWAKKGIPWSIEKGVQQMTEGAIIDLLRRVGFHEIRIEGHGLIPTRFFEGFPLLCTHNALHWSNIPIFRKASFRFMITGTKPNKLK